MAISSLFRSIDNRNNSVIAIKIINLEEAEDEIEDIQQEITVLSQCDSPFVTKYFGSFLKVRNIWIYHPSTHNIYVYLVIYSSLLVSHYWCCCVGLHVVDYNGVPWGRQCIGPDETGCV